MTFEFPSPRYSAFRQAVRRFAPSHFLPALAAHTAHLDPIRSLGKRPDDGRWPWAASAMARESVLYSNEFGRGGTPTEDDFTHLYNVFNDSADLQDNESISDIVTPLAYEQFGYVQTEFQELART